MSSTIPFLNLYHSTSLSVFWFFLIFATVITAMLEGAALIYYKPLLDEINPNDSFKASVDISQQVLGGLIIGFAFISFLIVLYYNSRSNPMSTFACFFIFGIFVLYGSLVLSIPLASTSHDIARKPKQIPKPKSRS